MKEKGNWNLLKKIEREVKPIDEGGDSTVYSIKNTETGEIESVAKNYDNFDLMGPGDPKVVEEVLRQYYLDTEKAKKMLEENPNPLNQSIEIGNTKYDLRYKIISQGEIILEQEKKNEFTKEKEIIKSSVGQEYVGGLNLHVLIEYPKGSTTIEEQKIFVKDYKLYQKLTEIIKKLFSYLSQNIGANFIYGAMNIKPFINEKDKTITFIITDLAASLSAYHKSNSKHKMLR